MYAKHTSPTVASLLICFHSTNKQLSKGQVMAPVRTAGIRGCICPRASSVENEKNVNSLFRCQ